MKLPRTAHTDRACRIHEITPDFRLEDVWALPTPGGPEEFPQVMTALFAGEFASTSSWPTRVVWATRWKLGALLGWDKEKAGLGSRVPTLRDRLPADLRDLPPSSLDTKPFTPLYELEHEWAAEMANRTVHTVMHLSWVPDPQAEGGYRGQMAVLVKPNGLFGSAYMAAIAPFRHFVVYPQLMRYWERRWKQRAGSVA